MSLLDSYISMNIQYCTCTMKWSMYTHTVFSTKHTSTVICLPHPSFLTHIGQQCTAEILTNVRRQNSHVRAPTRQQRSKRSKYPCIEQCALAYQVFQYCDRKIKHAHLDRLGQGFVQAEQGLGLHAADHRHWALRTEVPATTDRLFALASNTKTGTPHC